MSRTSVKTHGGATLVPARRYFTADGANRSLVLVRRVVSDIVGRYARLVDLQEIIEAAQTQNAFDRYEEAQRELMAVAEKLQSFAEELDNIGVELKDWSAGVVDFPCILDGREAYLCWRHGEPSVDFWHELDENSAGRQPLTAANDSNNSNNS